jgi:hypothetical protein
MPLFRGVAFIFSSSATTSLSIFNLLFKFPSDLALFKSVFIFSCCSAAFNVVFCSCSMTIFEGVGCATTDFGAVLVYTPLCITLPLKWINKIYFFQYRLNFFECQ